MAKQYDAFDMFPYYWQLKMFHPWDVDDVDVDDDDFDDDDAVDVDVDVDEKADERVEVAFVID